MLPNHTEGIKGELIALRQALVCQSGHYAPESILNKYLKRNNIVHGGFLQITSYLDYWHLLICCLLVVKSITELSRSHRDVSTLETLIAAIETPERLRGLIDQELGSDTDPKTKEIEKAARLLLAKLEGCPKT